jgi:anti-anti-sigma factor
MDKKSRAELVTWHCRRLSEMQMPHRHCPEGIDSLPCGAASRLVLALLLVSLSFAVGCGKTIAAPAVPVPEVEVASVVLMKPRERGYYMKRRGDSSTSSIEIAVDHSGVETIVRLKGRVDVDSSPDVRDRLRAILLTNPLPLAVSVDLADVTSIEASGIATMIEALRVARNREIRFHLQGQGSVFHLFESAGLLALFDKSPGGNGAS